ncbi:MAG: hypothetical protein JNL13_10215 [Chitinophagaceae bacterium]|nr:hypothetical protein [Chitinophagaceae bacterium]
MKYAKIAISMLSAFLLFYILSCRKDNNTCKSCMVRNDYQIVPTKILGLNVDFKMYRDSAKNYNLLFKKETEVSNFSSILSALNTFESIKSELQNNHIAAIVLFSNQQVLKDLELNPSQIAGVMVYFKNSTKNMMTVRVFKLQDQNPIEYENLAARTLFLSTNDIHDLASKLFQTKTSVALINYQLLPKGPVMKMDFQTKLERLNLSLSKTTVPNQPHQCSAPCSSGQGYCTASESQNGGEKWNCWSTQGCKKTDADIRGRGYMQDRNQNDSLYAFRDDYLYNTVKGQSYIHSYYALCESFSTDSMSFSFSIETLDIVESHVLPIIGYLKNHSNSQEILINGAAKTNLVNYMLKAKNKFTEEGARNRIDEIIEDINYLANKPTSEVHNFLNQ